MSVRFPRKEQLKNLEEALTKATMSEKLREAITEIIKAIKKGDYVLAFELSSCKSLITSKIKLKGTPEYPISFRESATKNKKVLGTCLYCLLDTINHLLAFRLDVLPAGMSVVSACGNRITIEDGGKLLGDNHIVKLIRSEKEAINKHFTNKGK